jgi:L-fucose isomerase-like protein
MNISDSEAEAELKNWSINTSEDLPQKALCNAVKLYLAVKEDIEKEDSVVGVGINCLNESKYSDTTPCLAWNMLYEKKGILWACEADVMSLLTAYIVSNSLDAPVMMSNIYPFLMGQAALKHERIPSFPEIVDEPENHILVAHCGYVGVIPKSFATEWTLRPKVLEIVDENAHVIDARLPTGDITLVKLDPSLSKILAIEGTAKGYVQYPGSDCRNGLVIKVNDGHEVIRKVYSHHQILVPGYHSREIELIGKVMNLEVEIL